MSELQLSLSRGVAVVVVVDRTRDVIECVTRSIKRKHAMKRSVRGTFPTFKPNVRSRDRAIDNDFQGRPSEFTAGVIISNRSISHR